MDLSKETSAGFSAAQIHHALVHVVQILLLRSQNRPWPGNADPADEGGGWEAEVLHAIEPNQRACSAKTGLAVNCDSSGLVFCSCEELRDDLIRRCRSIDEEEVEVLDALLGELGLLILRLIETNNERNAHSLKNGDVVVRGKRAISISDVEWSRESDELARDDPVEIAVLYFLEGLVLLHVEGVVVVPTEGDGVLEALEAVQIGTTIGAVAHGGVTIGNELVVVGAEGVPGVFCGLLEADYHKGTHQEGGVALLGIVERRVMINLVVLILLVVHEFLKFLAKEVHFAEVKRPEVSEERLVHQVVVNAKVEGVLAGLRRVLVADPVKTARNNLDRCVCIGVARFRCFVCFVLGLYHCN